MCSQRTEGGPSPSSSSQYPESIPDRPSSAGSNFSRQNQTGSNYPSYNTINRSSNIPQHKYFPPIIPEDQYAYQYPGSIGAGIHPTATQTLPPKKSFQNQSTLPNYSQDILDYSNTDVLEGVPTITYNDPVDFIKPLKVVKAASFNEGRRDLQSGYMSRLGLNSSHAAAKTEPSRKGSGKQSKSNAGSPQRESVV